MLGVLSKQLLLKQDFFFIKYTLHHFEYMNWIKIHLQTIDKQTNLIKILMNYTLVVDNLNDSVG